MRKAWQGVGAMALVMMLAATAGSAIAAEPAAPQDYRIIGYVADGPTLPAISAGKLDVINFAFAHVNAAHEVFLPHEMATASLAGLVKLRDDNPQLKILLSVGGWGAGNFSEAAASETARARFADTAVELVRRHDLDGLDIDWEYPGHPGPGISHSPADKHNFTLMLEAVRAKLDALEQVNPGREYLLTIAAADGEAARGLEIKRIAEILDWINLMTYDFYGSLTATTGHHAGLHRSAVAPAGSRTTEQAVDEFLAAGAPPRKINIGAAFYGRTFADVGAAHDGLQQAFGGDGGFVAWQEIADNHLDRNGFQRHWDEQAQAAWLWNPSTRRMISYEDPQALRAKAAFVRERGLGGIMYWEQRQDPKEQLLDVLVEGLK
ncbi:glycoside hydrolase family 18 protein [Pseudoxanthomonas indica]|uniref:chitinase n=1 Tax=Pseudoxanthomonas indica TaxID=428993 RepID=A0A1T5KNB5_9GAMM|nr:glycoside hydrolase family 18 protein [Pseudoxanthomonas indica]GGD50415.1 chitinase [Pseudoxanthomonas indica]SKC65187.1 chitinase [Pseudoxanthomonas indica]